MGISGPRHCGRSDGEGDGTQIILPDVMKSGWARFNRRRRRNGRPVSTFRHRFLPHSSQSSAIPAIDADVGTASDVAAIVGPSGCNSYNPPVDTGFHGNACTRKYSLPLRRRGIGRVHDFDLHGRHVFGCLGMLQTHWSRATVFTKSRCATVTYVKNPCSRELQPDHCWRQHAEIKEDTGDGSTIKVRCPADFGPRFWAGRFMGTGPMRDFSSVCHMPSTLVLSFTAAGMKGLSQ